MKLRIDDRFVLESLDAADEDAAFANGLITDLAWNRGDFDDGGGGTGVVSLDPTSAVVNGDATPRKATSNTIHFIVLEFGLGGLTFVNIVVSILLFRVFMNVLCSCLDAENAVDLCRLIAVAVYRDWMYGATLLAPKEQDEWK